MTSRKVQVLITQQRSWVCDKHRLRRPDWLAAEQICRSELFRHDPVLTS